MTLDRQLRDALAPKHPRRDLVEAVVAQLASHEPSRPIRRPMVRVYAFAAAIVAIISIGFGVAQQRAVNEERRRGELATRQLMTALAIASETLNDAQRLVKQTY
jgi:hypothetical protein